MPTARERLGELFGKVDAFFDQAAARFPGPDGITGRAGCDDCCRRRLPVPPRLLPHPGAAIRFASPDPGPPRRLPIVDACPRNFGSKDLASLPGAVLDQTTLSTVLGTLDAALGGGDAAAPRRAHPPIAETLARGATR